ncbi:MAG: DUF1566 domain-containing protein, partial [bacterium]
DNSTATYTVTVTVAPSLSVTYAGGTGSTGTAPIDSTHYSPGSTVTVLASSDAASSGGLRKTDYILAGWSKSASPTTVDYDPGATFNISSDITLTAVWKTPAVGMHYPNGGGIIYKAAGAIASIVTLTDLAPANWSTAKSECASTSIAVSGVAYTDGRLPTKDELNSIYIYASGGSGSACSIANKGNFCTGGGSYPAYYWSSTEYIPGSNAWDQDFANGSQYLGYETPTFSVRAVRAINY